ncbi:MAG TPA: GNAT family N-acetyltransferase [Rhizomicrobium sp.]|jgi:ribosomal protein S18 acetylase RimI-like enzyme
MDGVTIRYARTEDAPGIAHVHSTSWRNTYRGIVPQSYLDDMHPEKTVERWREAAAGKVPGAHLLVAYEKGKIIGFEVYGPAREPSFGYSGELYAAYFLPEAMGKGLGTEMMKTVVRDLAAQGLNDMIVWVMEANARGRRFYEKLPGGAVVPDSRKSFDIDGAEIWEIAYGFRPLPQVK